MYLVSCLCYLYLLMHHVTCNVGTWNKIFTHFQASQKPKEQNLHIDSFEYAYSAVLQ